jgi:hypothetical protein
MVLFIREAITDFACFARSFSAKGLLRIGLSRGFLHWMSIKLKFLSLLTETTSSGLFSVSIFNSTDFPNYVKLFF